MVEAALARWSHVQDEAFMAALAQVDIQVADLPGLELGEYRDGVVYLDRDAAGYGWFVDATPATDREYRLTDGLLSADQGPAAGHS